MKPLYPLVLGGLLLLGYQQSTKFSADTAAEAGFTAAAARVSPADTAFVITFNSTPPAELAANATPKQLAEFAWAEFLALNWKSNYNPVQKQRDTPDPKWNYRSTSPDLTVWETYAHRTELRPYRGGIRPFNSAPFYSFGKTILPARPGVSFTLFNNLDENNEIGSCNLYGQVKSGERMVLYQAKVNSYEYNYIRNKFSTNSALSAARKLDSANIKKYSAYYNPKDPKNAKYKGSTCNCPPNVLCLPCGSDSTKSVNGVGTIEIKTAWRQLNAGEDASKFLTRTVVYYRQQGTGPSSSIVYDNVTFALIGMHIIHKTVNYPDFVFATFEHKDVQKDNMGFRLILQKKHQPQQDSLGSLQFPYPRLHPLTATDSLATVAAHRKIKAQNPQSVLLNYRLVGVQGTPTSNTSTPNFFLANYVIESDSLLANFHGSGFGAPHNKGNNTLLKGKMLSAGGCQGCHGVAQLNGTDFSFLLDNFQKPVLAPDIDEDQQRKLIRYIRATTAKRK